MYGIILLQSMLKQWLFCELPPPRVGRGRWGNDALRGDLFKLRLLVARTSRGDDHGEGEQDKRGSLYILRCSNNLATLTLRGRSTHILQDGPYSAFLRKQVVPA